MFVNTVAPEVRTFVHQTKHRANNNALYTDEY